MTMHPLAALGAVLSSSLVPAESPQTECPLREDSDDILLARAQEHMERTEALLAEERYEAALAELDHAACAWPDRRIDFMRGTILQRQGDCEGAIAAYEAFVQQEPPSSEAEIVRAQMKACQEPNPAPASKPAMSASLPMTVPPPVRPEPKPEPMPAWQSENDQEHWSRDVPGGVMLGVGLAGVAVGTGVLAVGLTNNPPANSFQDFTETQRRNDRTKAAGIATMAVSSAVITAAIIRYVIVARRDRDRSRAMARRGR